MKIGYKISYRINPICGVRKAKYFSNPLYAMNFLHQCAEKKLFPILKTFEIEVNVNNQDH